MTITVDLGRKATKQTNKVFVRTIDSSYVSINPYPQHVLCLYIISYLCVMHLFSV